ncbi:hypothetical protein BDY24DRAFT_353035 [Mrakia frigida]|uniref:Ies6p n=1 Tax=Mrakia frigida TaxID=29902 RepID=UPI003FCC23C2
MSSSKFKKGRVPGPSRLGSPHQAGSPAPSAMVEKASFFHHPRPFKDPHWQRKKDAKGKPRNLKQVLQAERDRCPRRILESGELGEALGYTTLHPPPSLLPPKKYCDITGLVAPYRDPKTTLQFHSKEVYEVLKTLPPGADQAYLDIRGKGTAIH